MLASYDRPVSFQEPGNSRISVALLEISHWLEDTVEGLRLSKFLFRPSREAIAVSTILRYTFSQNILYT